MTEHGLEVDDTGSLPDGTVVDGIDGLRNVLMMRKDEFVETFAEKYLPMP